MLKTFLLLTATLLFAIPVSAADSTWDQNVRQGKAYEITVYHSPTCGCCSNWIAHLEKHGFKVTSIKTDNVQKVKQQQKLPALAASCHTALVEGYLIEGHVPANDIKNLIESGDKTIRGLSVPAMPAGTPGMEMGGRKDAFDVVSFDESAKISIYHHYADY